MKLTVKHKKGRFYADWYSTIRIFFFMLWRDEVEVTLYFNSKDVALISNDSWLKIAGWKSGINTSTNTECIAAYRNINGELDYAEYKRYSNIPNRWYVNQYGSVKDISTNPYQYVIKYNLKRPKGCFIPVFPWAGGRHLPENDYSYTLILK